MMKTNMICPNCKSGKAIKIIYGEPDLYLMNQMEKGFVHLGGCVISLNDPKYFCKNCNKNIYKNEQKIIEEKQNVEKKIIEFYNNWKKEISKTELKRFKNMKKEELYKLHFGLGLFIRNTDLHLNKYFCNMLASHYRVFDEDSMSSIIIEIWHDLIQKEHSNNIK